MHLSCSYNNHLTTNLVSLPSLPHYFEANPGCYEYLLREESGSVFLQDMGDYLDLKEFTNQ